MTTDLREAPEPDPAGSRPAPKPARGRSPGPGTHLGALALPALLPAIAFGAAAAWEALRRQDVAEEARLVDTARALAAAVDAQIQAHVAALQVLAASPDAEDPPDWPALEEHARNAAAIFGAWVS